MISFLKLLHVCQVTFRAVRSYRTKIMTRWWPCRIKVNKAEQCPKHSLDIEFTEASWSEISLIFFIITVHHEEERLNRAGFFFFFFKSIT